MAAIQVTIHDGRAERDPSKVDNDGYGEVLGTAEVDKPLDVGDKIRLQDGTEVIVIGMIETISPSGMTQRVAIGNMPAPR